MHKSEITKRALNDNRWNPELFYDGYVWCFDCQYFKNEECNHEDNPHRTVQKCPQAPRICQWYKQSKDIK